MKRVLIPLDGSVASERALDEGLEQLPDRPAEIVLLHCLDLNRLHPSASRVGPHSLPELKEQDRRRNEVYLEQMASTLVAQGYRARSVVVCGHPAPAILQAARDQRVDLILMTTHGRGALGRALLGSVAEAVLRRSDIPVLVLPPARPVPDSQKAYGLVKAASSEGRERQLA